MALQNHEIIGDMVRRIVERAAPERVILYGSYARGEAASKSDADFLVLFRDLPDPRAAVSELYAAVSGCGLPKDVVAATVATFERYKDVINTLFWSAAREGKVVYERPA
jgi:predicted nucleotidyltransferase